eukprot:TRINITY_DN6333_c0_g1_i6.p1 TRINITY_DN6333_c0_g1~~TRINITY_DN6333_c0_g1_i6.p1  ORF type:complete len:145 (-),score=9.68 TRINITY_DN6333_c0_g1_i6:22-456(-)
MGMKFIFNMFEKKLRTKVDVNYFGRKVAIDKEFSVGDSNKRYVYQVTHDKIKYIIKGYRIQDTALELDPPETMKVQRSSRIVLMRSTEYTKSNLSCIIRWYFFGRFACVFNPHLVKFLSLDLSLIHICRCRRYAVCRSRWSPYH